MPPSRGNPSTWDRGGLLGPRGNARFLEVDGLRVKYIGPGVTDKDAASVRSDRPIPSSSGVYYWEVEVLSTGRDGFIGVGLSAPEVKLERLPGWDARSYGYHGDDGHAFRGSGTGIPYGPCYGAGDVVGILFNVAERTISFTKNGIDLGVAFERVDEERLHPSVGLRTPGEEVRAFFPPRGPFRGDVGALRAAAAERAAARALKFGEKELVSRSTASTTADEAATAASLKLALDHLRHIGAKKAAVALVKEISESGGVGVGKKGAFPVEEEEEEAERRDDDGDVAAAKKKNSTSAAARRLDARRLVLEGDIPAAREAAEAAAPGAIAANARLDFLLDVQRFVELVRGGDDDGAMSHGAASLRASRAEGAAGGEGAELLADAMSLLAYADPASSPAGKLLSVAARRSLADDVDACLRAAAGLPPRSALDAAARQALVAHEELASADACGDPDAALVDLAGVLGLRGGGEGGDETKEMKM